MVKRKDVDMSPAAIARRLEDVRQLYRLGMSLVEAGRAAGLNRGIGRPGSKPPGEAVTEDRSNTSDAIEPRRER